MEVFLRTAKGNERERKDAAKRGSGPGTADGSGRAESGPLP